MHVSGFFIGSIVSVLIGNTLVGSSFVLKKYVSHKLNAAAANDPSSRRRRGLWTPAQLKSPAWWCAFCMLAVGELCNFVGYLFLPLYVVVLMGCVSVMIAQILSVFVLREHITSVRITGTILTATGVAVVIASTTTPTIRQEAGVVDSFPEILQRLPSPEVVGSFTVCATVVCVLCVLEYLRRKTAASANNSVSMSVGTNITMYAGSAYITVFLTKVVGIILDEAFRFHVWRFTNVGVYLPWIPWVVFLVIQIFLLNVGLHYHPANVITPLFYISYTLAGLACSGLVFLEFGAHDYPQLLLLSSGVVFAFTGVWMITRDFDRSMGCWPWCCPAFPFEASARAVELPLFETDDRASSSGTVSGGTLTPIE